MLHHLTRIATVLFMVLLAGSLGAAEPAPAVSPREQLIQAILSQDVGQQVSRVSGLMGAGDPVVAQALTLWREGGLFVHEEKIPFLLEAQMDKGGKSRAIQLKDTQPLLGTNGQPLFFFASELTPVDTSSKLRKAIKATLDLFNLGSPLPQARLDAATKLGQRQNPDYLPQFKERLLVETAPQVRKALEEALALTELNSSDPTVRRASVERLGALHSFGALPLLQRIVSDDQKKPDPAQAPVVTAARQAVAELERYLFYGNMAGTVFRGLSLSAVLLVVALGLAITFGLMGVINMAHGEVMMAGAYAAYVTQNLFVKWFGSRGLEFYFPFALAAAFLGAALIGIVLERGIIRFLYRRPLESLLATWGMSLVLQQVFRMIFGAANVQVSSPQWLSGSFTASDVLFAYNRLFVIAFAVLIVFATYLLLTRTSMGLQMRAVMQNRQMASCLGVRTDRVNLFTFALGSGLAGMAGACLSQIGNVGPNLGQAYIVDCFMIVVLGGVGNLVGTVSAACGVGMVDQVLQPFLGAVMGKITVLAGIILFLQWRPSGLFVTRSRSLD